MLGVDDLFQNMGVAVVRVTLHEKDHILKSNGACYLTSILLLSFEIVC
jgi:hypothetical protein